MIYDRRKSGLWTPRHGAPAVIPSWRREAWAFRARQAAAGAASGTATDPYFANVSILVQPKSTDADGTILDYSNNAATVNKSGNITSNNSVVYYASTKSVVSDGSGDAISCTAISAYNLTGVDFTGESLVYLNNVNNNRIFEQVTGNFNDGHAMYTNASGKLRYSLNAGGASIIDIIGTTTMSTSTWYYCAIVRSGNTFTLYLNGASEGSTVSATGPVNYTSSFVMCAGDGVTSSLNGEMNFFRLTKSVARTIGGIPASPLPYS